VLDDRAGRRRVAVIAQPGVARLARSLARDIRSLGLRAEVRIVPDREAVKTLEAVGEIYLWLNDLGLTREDTIVGMGGGALTDAAGFVAATYLRGVEAVYVPTTLLGAVDAAVGGKTAVNVGGKNLVGAFAHPRRVVVDADVLDRLPVEIVREGAAEALKAGLIGDVELVELYERAGLDADVEEVVRRAVAVKAGVVGRDFTESGERAHLNYGHTVGHAVEVAAPMSHGHAVAVGMVAAGRVSALVAGFADEERQRAAIERLGLPTSAPGVRRDEALRLMALDKKRAPDGLRFVVLEAIGRPSVRVVDPATLDAALHAVGITDTP
ncbi:MAG TPA: 3-dehydroquinate synthase family protein, partial [Acidimicrobiia bacterium]|nr:3-dehydroquinate synthase family protein [Acidimicrobiia bacterium]